MTLKKFTERQNSKTTCNLTYSTLFPAYNAVNWAKGRNVKTENSEL